MDIIRNCIERIYNNLTNDHLRFKSGNNSKSNVITSFNELMKTIDDSINMGIKFNVGIIKDIYELFSLNLIEKIIKDDKVNCGANMCIVKYINDIYKTISGSTLHIDDSTDILQLAGEFKRVYGEDFSKLYFDKRVYDLLMSLLDKYNKLGKSIDEETYDIINSFLASSAVRMGTHNEKGAYTMLDFNLGECYIRSLTKKEK